MQLMIAEFEAMIGKMRSTDIVFVSVGIDDSPEGWAKNLQRVLALPTDKRPALLALGFHGYEEDERELFEIDEVRDWARRLVEHDVDCVRALMDEERTAQRGQAFAAIAGQAYGRAKLLGLVGHAEYIWKAPGSRAMGYSLVMTESGNKLLSNMERLDALDELLTRRGHGPGQPLN